MNQQLSLTLCITLILANTALCFEYNIEPVTNKTNPTVEIIDYLNNNHFNSALELLNANGCPYLNLRERTVINHIITNKEFAYKTSFPRFVVGACTVVYSLNTIGNYEAIKQCYQEDGRYSAFFFAPTISLLSGAKVLFNACTDIWNISEEDRKTLAQLKKLVNRHAV